MKFDCMNASSTQSPCLQILDACFCASMQLDGVGNCPCSTFMNMHLVVHTHTHVIAEYRHRHVMHVSV